MLTLQMMQPLPNYLQPNVVTFSVIMNCTILRSLKYEKHVNTTVSWGVQELVTRQTVKLARKNSVSHNTVSVGVAILPTLQKLHLPTLLHQKRIHSPSAEKKLFSFGSNPCKKLGTGRQIRTHKTVLCGPLDHPVQ
jgi:hypothetical protein